MRLNQIVSALVVFLIVHSCTTTKLVEEGQAAYQQGNYETALAKWEQIIIETEKQAKLVDSSLYYKAGMAALKLDKKDKAQQYFVWADDGGFSSPDMYLTLSGTYRDVDNLSLEIEMLENYHREYPEGAKIDSVNARLFETYIESEQWSKAKNLWPEIENQAEANIEILTDYFLLNSKLENEVESSKTAQRLLVLDENNITGLEWKAMKFFKKADDLYVKEMKAYEENRSRKQYRQLLKAWDKIWPDFRKSRDLFEKLYKLKPKAEYAKYLGHIYTRMDKEQKAEYWYKKAEENNS